MVNVTPQGLVSTGLTLAGLSTQAKRVDVVQVLDQTLGQQVFSTARPMKAMVNEMSRGLRYPIETGAVLTDSIIVLPLEITIDFFIPDTAYATAYPAIRNGRLSGTYYTIQTRTGIYRNMFIEEMPHEENIEAMNAVILSVKFVEAIQITASNGTTTVVNNYAPASPQMQNTQYQGLLKGVAIAGSAVSYVQGANVLGFIK